MNQATIKPDTVYYDVAIIGSGPAGISAALTLKKNGINNIIILEREPEAGGVPRHCNHPPFGFKTYKKILTGPQYAQKNVQQAQAHRITTHCKTTVVKLGEAGKLTLYKRL